MALQGCDCPLPTLIKSLLPPRILLLWREVRRPDWKIYEYMYKIWIRKYEHIHTKNTGQGLQAYISTSNIFFIIMNAYR